MWEWLKADAVLVVGLVALVAWAIVFCIDFRSTKNAFKVKNVWRKRRKRRKPTR